jgi:uracil-DNA glycosylase
VVVLGQDPYHNPGQAHGLSFSVLPGVAPPPSLVNIYKEVASDVGGTVPTHGYLAGWARQGVLLLNAVLTVRQNQPASHAKKGWEQITDAVVKHLNEEGDHLVFILWGMFPQGLNYIIDNLNLTLINVKIGAHAQKKGSGIDRKKHLVLTAVHPSPLSSHRGFFGSKPFSKTNEYLEMHGKTPINWTDLPKNEPPFSIEGMQEQIVDDSISPEKCTAIVSP